MMTSVAPAAVCLAATGALVFAEHRAHARLRIAAKVFAAGGFLTQAWLCEVPLAGPAGQALSVGLLASAVGDLALLGRSERSFLIGLGSFLVAHLAYSGAFWLLGVDLFSAAMTGVVAALVGGLAWRWLGPHVGSMRLPVFGYMVAICAMVTLAGGALGAQPDTGRRILLASAWLFLISDLCVARDQFVAPGPQNRTVGLPLYFLSQLGFVWGMACAAP